MKEIHLEDRTDIPRVHSSLESHHQRHESVCDGNWSWNKVVAEDGLVVYAYNGRIKRISPCAHVKADSIIGAIGGAAKRKETGSNQGQCEAAVGEESFQIFLIGEDVSVNANHPRVERTEAVLLNQGPEQPRMREFDHYSGIGR